MASLLPLLVNSIFVSLLVMIAIGIISLRYQRQLTPEVLERRLLIDKMGFRVILPITYGIAIVTVLIILTTDLKIFENNDISNWLTLLVEIGIGIAIALTILIYSRHYDQKNIEKNREERLNRENHARNEIYRILRSVTEVVKNRERIRTMDPRERPDVDLKVETMFMNKQVKRIIESLPFVLSLHSENLPLKFIERVRDAIGGLDLVLSRLELLPEEKCDPGDNRTQNMDGFIEELQKISSDID